MPLRVIPGFPGRLFIVQPFSQGLSRVTAQPMPPPTHNVASPLAAADARDAPGAARHWRRWDAQGDGAPIRIDLVLVELQLLDARERLRGKSLVQLDQIEVAGALRNAPRGMDWAQSHHRRFAADRSHGRDHHERSQPALSSPLFVADHQHRRAVIEAGRIACCKTTATMTWCFSRKSQSNHSKNKYLKGAS